MLAKDFISRATEKGTRLRILDSRKIYLIQTHLLIILIPTIPVKQNSKLKMKNP